MALRLVHLFTGSDGQSHFAVDEVPWEQQDAVNAVSSAETVHAIFFEETAAGSSLGWHNAPHRQYVITLTGRLQFETRDGTKQVIQPGAILLAEDTTGGGHRWRLIDDQPWRRAYVTLPPIPPVGVAIDRT